MPHRLSVEKRKKKEKRKGKKKERKKNISIKHMQSSFLTQEDLDLQKSLKSCD